MSNPSLPSDDQPVIPMPRLVNLVRQVTHDVRNGLNAIDLQAAFLAELAGEGEMGEEVGKLRGMVSHVTHEMQELSGRFGELRPVLVSYPVQEFLQGLKEAVEAEFERQAKRIVWEVKVGDEEMEMDYNLVTAALLELARNAIFFREGDQAIHFTTRNEGENVVFEVRQSRSQPLTDPDQWGREPLVSGRRGGYGLGLFYVRRIVDTLGGELEPGYDAESGELRVRLSLPLKGGRQPGSKE
jgi:signal transduction histidine kinase